MAYDPDADRVDVVDYKFGREPVEDAETNCQGFAYVIGAVKQFGASKARMTFICPRQGVISEHEFHAEDFPLMRRRIELIIERCESARASDADASHPQTCQRCGHAGWCPAFAKANLRALAKVGHDIPKAVDPAALTDPEQIARVMQLVPQVEYWIDKLKEVATQRMIEGCKIRGWRLMVRKGHRTLRNPAAIQQVLEAVWGIPPSKFLEACAVNISALERLVDKDQHPIVQAKLAEKNLLITAKDTYYIKKDNYGPLLPE